MVERLKFNKKHRIELHNDMRERDLAPYRAVLGYFLQVMEILN